ncbi:putative guanylate cyclase [Trypanosoma grayi]|uniref:putative guanylate cyclase n=1 Tax=Trypanosoma grayi TaxID=71804 RepID=UPI0004F4B5F0|nr:putative guanylate cyclase [Trypanosoma grayi]KEG10964.1 putative guanylate cyclase [Trypanosoma grayi]
MLVSRRIAALQQLEQKLRRIVKEEAILCFNTHKSRVDLGQQVKLKRCADMKEKLLFRQVPVTLSLLERSFLPILRDAKPSSYTSADANGVVLLEDLTMAPSKSSDVFAHTLPCCGQGEKEPQKQDLRVGHVTSKKMSCQQQRRLLSSPGRMLRLLCSLHFLEQERRKLFRYHGSRLDSKLRATEQTARLAHKKQKDKNALTAARQSVSEAKADVVLLQNSLLSRSYISARLWRLLLHEEIWLAAVREGHTKGAATAPSVLLMLLSFTRLGFGVLQDSVQGHALNTHAPRFVVSLPSHKMRRRKNAGAGASDAGSRVAPSPHASVEEAGDSEDLLGMMMMTMTTKAAVASPTTVEERSESESMIKTVETPRSTVRPANDRKEGIQWLRWLPPSSCNAASLALETLALCSLILPTLDITTIVVHCGQAQELFELLSVLQVTASSLLALHIDKATEETVVLHHTLRRLEDAMLGCGKIAKQALVMQADGSFPPLPPVKAARLLLGLGSMHLLQTDERTSHQLLSKLVVCIFPQLSTGTQRALMAKSRQNSLYAFATRSHRAKLCREHGRKNMESALLESVRARARLQQRQMQAALRTKYLEEINNRSVGQLAESLPVYSLIALFNLLVQAARDAPRHENDSQGLLVTAALFVAEGVLVAGARTSSGENNMLQPGELPVLLSALGVLWPLVNERYQLLHHSMGGHHLEQRRGMGDSLAKSEMVMVSYLTDMIFGAVNAAVAERVQRAETTTKPLTETGETGQILAVDDIIAIVSGLNEWCALSPNSKSTAYVEATAGLLRQLLVVDMELWKELRQLSEFRQQQFLQTLGEVMRRSNMMDATVTRALSVVF